MCRSYAPTPLPDGLLDDLIDTARRAPSAGNTQGVDFLVLDAPAAVERYWSTTLPVREGFPWPGLLRAPALVVPLADPDAYVARYGESDKAHTGLGAHADSWPMPYWVVDAAFATMSLLTLAEDAGLGALFFGLFDHAEAVCAAFGVPDGLHPIGTVALGHPDEADHTSMSARRPRRALGEVIRRPAL